MYRKENTKLYPAHAECSDSHTHTHSDMCPLHTCQHTRGQVEKVDGAQSAAGARAPAARGGVGTGRRLPQHQPWAQEMGTSESAQRVSP